MLNKAHQGQQAAESGPTHLGSLRNARRNLRRERRLWHNPEQATEALGCRVCPERELCGGLKLGIGFFDCLQFCCGRPENCDRVCPYHPEFADRVREVGTFRLDNVPRAPRLAAPPLPAVVPILYHKSGRSMPPVSGTAALSLYEMFSRRTGMPRFSSSETLCEAFRIRPGATTILTGTARDAPLERWWELGEERRTEIIRAMRRAGIALVTTPNYSLFIDRPRLDDLHAVKRIATVHEEFLREGLPAALHVNGRTDRDFERWAEFIAARPEITHIAYEFTTGAGWANRRQQHAAWLAALAAEVGRPLHLIVRGGVDLLRDLAPNFSGLTVLDSSIFLKTMKRRRAYVRDDGRLGWTEAPTKQGEPLDELFSDNYRTMEDWIAELLACPPGEVRLAG